MAAHLLFKLGQFRENGEFIDVRLKVDKSIFPAHRNVLAANSDYFHAMFTNGMKESNQEVIALKDENLTALGFKVVMDSIYSGELLVNKENVFEVLTTANHLQMAIIARQCCDFLDKEFIQGCIDIQTYLHLLAFADLHGLKDLKEAALLKMASLYREVCESEEFLSHISTDQFLNLLSRDDLSAPSETFVFKSVMQWIKHKKEERMTVAAKVIGAVRLGLVDTKDVVEELNTEEMQRLPEIQMLMCEKLLHSNMPSPNSKFAVEKTRPRSMTAVLVAIFPCRPDRRLGMLRVESKESLTFIPTKSKYFDAGIRSWRSYPSMATLDKASQCICAEFFDNYLYVAAKELGNASKKKSKRIMSQDTATNAALGGAVVIYRYDPVSNVWETLPRFQGSDVSVGCLCSVNEHIYVFSDSDAPQRYSSAQKDWQSGSELPFLKKKDDEEKLVFVKAVSMKSKIYVLHGFYRENHGNYEAKPAVVHCFDPQKNVWKKKASTIHPHFESSLIVDNNQLYVAGGTVSISRYPTYPGGFIPIGYILSGYSSDQESECPHASGDPAPVEVYNELNNYWSVVEQKHIPSNNLGAVEILGGKVYFILNKFPFDSGIRIPANEVYKISLKGWESFKTIGSVAVLCYLSVKKEVLNESQAAAKSTVTGELE